jgi:hypothetical protein
MLPNDASNRTRLRMSTGVRIGILLVVLLLAGLFEMTLKPAETAIYKKCVSDNYRPNAGTPGHAPGVVRLGCLISSTLVILSARVR